MTRKAKAPQGRSKGKSCISMLVSAEEREQLQAAAQKASMPMSVFLRTMILMTLKSGETLAVVRTKA